MPNSLELNVSPALLHTFANHPFHVRKDMEMNELVDSIRESGVIVPLIVRSRPEGGYEIISGHRRCEACRELGIEKVPVRVQELTDDEATILMVNSNIQREHVLPSEKAFAYKMKVEAIKHQGRTTSSQVGMKSQTLDLVGKELNESRNQVHRYIRLTYLISPILQMVDESRMAFNPAVEISYMTPEHQRWLQAEMELCEATPSLVQSRRLKEMSQSGNRIRPICKPVYFTEDEWLSVATKMAESDMPNFSAFCREMLLTGKVKHYDFSVIKEISSSLSHISGNINQVAKRCNTNQSVTTNDVEQLRREYLQLKSLYQERLVKALRKLV